MPQRIVLTGGGTAGHVTPNLALIPLLQKDGWEIHYIGSYQGMERELVEPVPGVTYHPIASGKFRRYLDPKNLSDPFRVMKGLAQAHALLGRLRPRVIFSKGGFVSVPVAWAGGMRHIPTVLHESDMTPGLANRLALPMCSVLCTTFPEAAAAVPKKGVWTGAPIRPQLLTGDARRGLAFAALSSGLPVLLIMGGSSGARAINEAVDAILPDLLRHFQVIHIRGSGSLNPQWNGTPGYAQFEYVKDELNDLFAACDLVLSRAGANAIWEFAALERPMLLIPLPLSASRGDQILNAQSFVKQGMAKMLDQDTMTREKLFDAIMASWAERDAMVAAQRKADSRGGLQRLLEQIYKAADFKPQNS